MGRTTVQAPDFSRMTEGKRGEVRILWDRLDIEINDVEMPEKLALILSEVGVRYIGDLVSLTKDEFQGNLRKLKKMRPASAKHMTATVDEMLAGTGLSWGMSAKETYNWLSPERRRFLWGCS